jgi:hypothetical protein
MEEHKKGSTDDFKECSMCSTTWRNRDDFLTDRDVKVVGYMVNFKELELGVFLFNHELCGTTLAISASEFTDLYDGPVYSENLLGTEECPDYCLRKSEIRTCPAACECAYVRDVLNKVANWAKS